MEIIPPIKLTLAGSSTPSSYVYPAWVTETWYDQGETVRRQFNSVWYDFRAKYTLYSTVGPQLSLPYWQTTGWEYRGPSAVTAGNIDYKTDFDYSESTAWSTGASVYAGQTVFDPADLNDYVANEAITAGNNTVRPSEAVNSTDDTIAGYWSLLGAANAWALLDYELATRTKGLSSGIIRTTDAAMFLLPATPSVNAIASPHVFGSSWTTSNCSVTSNNANSPETTPAATADTVTASGNNAYIYRGFTGYKVGDKVVFAVWAKSANSDTLTLRFDENSTTKQTETYTLTTDWKYYQCEYTVTQTSVTVNIIVGMLASSGKSMVLWGAHFGLCGDCFNRYVMMGVKNCKSVKADFAPFVTSNDMWPIAAAASHVFDDFPAEPRRDRPTSFNRVRDYTVTTGTGSWNKTYTNSDVIYFTNTSAILLELSPRNPAKMMEIASFACGEATYIGGTEWDVETSMLSFSRKERDDTFGTVTFIKRGTSKQVRATAFIDPDVVTGDTVQAVLTQFDGEPVFWDFNNAGSDYDRLRVFGFHTNVRLLIKAETYESLSIDIEGLVE